MKQRYIDFALLAGIGVLLIAILVLALSAAPMRGSAADDPLSAQPNAEANDQQTEQSEPLAGSEGASTQEETQDQPSEEADNETEAGVSAVDVTPEEGADVEGLDNASVDTETNTDTQTSDAEQSAEGVTDESTDQTTDQAQVTEESQTETEQTTTPETEQTVPTGNVTLERVGFAFITAESGACSIPLQPWRQVAVSRDLLAEYGCGTEITVDLADTVDGKDQVTAQIADTMNPSFERTVNIFVGEEEPALEYGVTTGTIEGTAP